MSGHLHHYRWDLDKTYLRTEFDTFRDLVRTFRQRADEKQVVPGARTLLRELLHPDTVLAPRRVTFISGSPRQMRKVLTERLRLDGIEPVEFILKPNLENLLKLRIRAVRGQVGYKLEALLRSRIHADRVEEVLFGDDAEHDAYIYSLYGDLIAGRIGADRLLDILVACRVYTRDIDRILTLQDTLRPAQGSVRRIIIHLDRRSPVRRFLDYGARVVPVFNYFQASLVLFGDGQLPGRSLLHVLEALKDEGYTPTRIANSVQDLMRRGFLSPVLFARVEAELDAAGQTLGRPPSAFLEASREALELVHVRERPTPPWIEDVDYLALVGSGRFKPPRLREKVLQFLE
ncbi:MAG: hypothetical protein EA398_06440 [Deltaproteobacteria bacterium]|nr:MAG: hypothetical protein EA398_06440 [Deltaproteobacteria bacterium]